MKSQILKFALLGGGALSVLAPLSTAMAQAPAARDDSQLQEVVVTAQRTESALQRTPIAVTAVSGADLRAKSVSTLLDLQTFTPSLQIGSRSVQGMQQGSFSIRGMGVDAVASAPSVGIYVDEVYYPSGSGNLLGLFDVERVEVLRGPQGTLFGRNTIAGAVQYISVKPTNKFTGFAEATLGDFNRRDFSGALTVPLGDTLAARFSFQTTTRDGFVHDTLNNIDRGDDKVTQGRVQIRWTPTPKLTVDLKADDIRQSNNGRALGVTAVDRTAQLASLATNPFIFGPFAYLGPYDNRFVNKDNYTIAGFNGSDSFKFRYQSAQGTIRYDLSDNVTFKSISAVSRSRQRSVLDFDATPAAIIQGYGGNPEITDLFTQEFQLTGRSLANRLRWTAGVYYYDTKDSDQGRGFVLGLLPPAIGFQPSNGDTLVKTKAKAAYGQAVYSLTDQFSVTLGLRYSEETTDATNITFPRPPLSKTFKNTSPLIGLNFQVDPDTLLYAKASKGFRSGGFAISNALAAGFAAFVPETAWSYEVGARMEFLGHRLRINPTAYYTDWKNIQFNALIIGKTPDGLPTTVVATSNAGDAEIWGAELETQFAVTNRLTLTGSAAAIDGKYTRIAPGIALTPSSDLQRAPKFKYAVGARYAYPLADGSKLAANVDWSHTSSQRSATLDPDGITMPAFGLLNARIQYTAPGGRWSLAVFGTNLTDKYYLIGGSGVSLLGVIGISEVDLARPREFGATLRVGF